jgi:undecaprenyl pyrophosphate phosphatase UppP
VAQLGTTSLVIGLVSSFAVALLSIRVFLRILAVASLEIFGWYRVIVGLLVLWLML